jgi:hypothetical protein
MVNRTIEYLVGAVKRHATANYEKDGWDFLIECHTDEEIKEAIGAIQTEAAAIKAVQKFFHLKMHNEMRAAARAEGDC